MMIFKKIFMLLTLSAGQVFSNFWEDDAISQIDQPFQICFEGVGEVEKKNPHDMEEIAVTEGDRFTLTLNFNNLESSAGINKVANLENVIKGGLQNFSHQFHNHSEKQSSINGKVSKTISLSFSMHAKKIGRLKLGPFECNVGNKHLTWPAIAVKVQEPSNEKKQDCFVSLELEGNKTKLYVFQRSKLKIKIYFDPKTVDTRYLSLTQGVEAPDFELKQLGQSHSQEVVNGRIYKVEIVDYMIIPQKTGIHEFPPVEISYATMEKNLDHNVDVLFSRFFAQPKSVSYTRSNRLNIEAIPLPENDQLVNALGSFSRYYMKLDKQNCEKSEPIKLTTTIEGCADFESISHPELSLPRYIKSYPSESQFTPFKNGDTMTGKKDFSYILQVDEGGEVEIPAQTFTFFDPERDQFFSLSSKAESIFVRGEKNIQQKTTDPEQATVEAPEKKQAEISILNDTEHHKTHSSSKHIPWKYFWLMIILTLFGGVGTRAKSTVSKIYKKRYILGITIKKLALAISSNNLSEIYKIILDFFAHKLLIDENKVNIDILGKTMIDKHGMSKETWDQFHSFFNLCLEVSFGHIKLTAAQSQELLSDATRWLNFFEELFDR